MCPVRNEGWIIREFLANASLYADVIILADQNSTDDTRDIAKLFPKVHLIVNESDTLNERERQEILVTEARKFGEHNLLIALDADEIFTPNFISSRLLETFTTYSPGTAFQFDWANVQPDGKLYRSAPLHPIAFIDDGSEVEQALLIHRPRLPIQNAVAVVKIPDVKVLHFQYWDWQRMLSKQRWYQVWEVQNKPKVNPLDLYRTYHHMHSDNSAQMVKIPEEWLDGLKNYGLVLEKLPRNMGSYWWDIEVQLQINKHGLSKFVKLDLDALFPEIELGRSKFDRLVLSYLRGTQFSYRIQPLRFSGLFLYGLDRLIRRFW